MRTAHAFADAFVYTSFTFIWLQRLLSLRKKPRRLWARRHQVIPLCGDRDVDEDGHVYGVCQRPKDHETRWHAEWRDGKLWVEWADGARWTAEDGAE